jgi:hypothetical protein
MMADVPNLFIWSLHNNGKLYELRKHESLTAKPYSNYIDNVFTKLGW